jgi:tetratricopeptide (TPR) repeat protein
VVGTYKCTMALSIIENLNRHWEEAAKYNDEADWEHMDRELDCIWVICNRPNFPNAASLRQRCRCEQGKVARRQGRYVVAEAHLHEALCLRNERDMQRADVMGELSTVYMQRHQFEEAKIILQQQYSLAHELLSSENSRDSTLSAELQMCRAVGNLGMVNYHLAINDERPDKTLLKEAIAQLWKRVASARDLQKKLLGTSEYEKVRTWEALGRDRLTLCYAADGDLKEAVRCGEMSQATAKCLSDPTTRALSRFFYGYALWRSGRRDDAIEQWEFAEGGNSCTSVMALCKEPSEEQRAYLRIMLGECVRMDGYDEQNHSALDYAVFCGDEETENLVLQGLARTHSNPEIQELRAEAHLRKLYRQIFQETFRRELMKERSDCIATLRSLYARLLDTDETKRRLLDRFKYVRYADFDRLGRLPTSNDHMTRTFSDQNPLHDSSAPTEYVIFISYRWIGKESHQSSHDADSIQHTQYKRVRSAVREFLDTHPEKSPEKIAIWLVRVIPNSLPFSPSSYLYSQDSACIDQDDTAKKVRGISSLPLIIAQCDAIISLVDDTYYSRAWCAVEVLLMQTMALYKRHECFEHLLNDPFSDPVNGHLQQRVRSFEVEISDLRVTYESDRPLIAFLVRQSKLLGRTGS